MHIEDTFDVLYTHTEGEPLCIVHSGINYPAATTILQKWQYLKDNYDWLRLALMREPRGHKDMVGVFVTPPSEPGYDAGLIYMDATDYQFMCGHGTIAIAMAMVARGMVKRAVDGITTIRFETLAGPVTAKVEARDGRVLSTEFQNVPAYVAYKDIDFDLPGLGKLRADVVWGGNYFAVIDIRDTKLRISPETGKDLIHYGILARDQLRKLVQPQHPTEKHVKSLDFVTFWHDPTVEGAMYKNVHVFGVGQLDRAPGGTAMSGMLALLESRGAITLNQTIKAEGLLGSGLYEGTVIAETDLGGTRAVVPVIKGKANLLGSARWTFDRNDPVDAGFIVA
ncbi:proline racemase family protein [Rhizobium sp. 18055]|jgi:proline racemase|uniref:proline racemase family protein n=1 Tax=Rhizobium sp. 18055 TaxID=2681403 RepID=UPI0013568CA3|nr:proline racemase family protein [Rhizobium sp. 18055]